MPAPEEGFQLVAHCCGRAALLIGDGHGMSGAVGDPTPFDPEQGVVEPVAAWAGFPPLLFERRIGCRRRPVARPEPSTF